jgi:hypothetical protein
MAITSLGRKLMERNRRKTAAGKKGKSLEI